MRALLDTNILIHREAGTVVRDDIGILFRWLDQLQYDKIVHPDSISEIRTHSDPNVVRSFDYKILSYKILKTRAPDTQEITLLRNEDTTDNDTVDTSLLAEVAAERVDFLITEDRGIHRKAKRILLASRVFTIDAFLEKVTAENPTLADYKVLSVKKELFGNIDVRDTFLDSFRLDYPEFDSWFNRKADDTAYICTTEAGNVVAFLYIKPEGRREDYSDINPIFERDKRLKIGTFKVISNGFKLGERFLKIVFDNALRNRVTEIYVTIFPKTWFQYRLILFLEDWGFKLHGTKGDNEEMVYVRDFRQMVDSGDPRKTYPYISNKVRKFIVPIYPAYHTELLPDSILNTESPTDFIEDRPNRNALSKVYVSRSVERNLRTGDIIVFYRTKSAGPAYYTSVATTIGVVQGAINKIPDLKTFLATCRKRSVFSDAELERHWNYNRRNRPFVVNFLYIYSLPKRPNLKSLLQHNVITAAPRGFERISNQSFEKLLQLSDANARFVVS